MPFDKAFLPVADRFLRFLSTETGFPVIVCDETGTVVRATDRKRIGTVHAGAQRILRGEVDEAAVTAEEAEENPLVKEGFNCPILVDGQKVGTVGIAGTLDRARPVARISSAILASWINDTRQQGLLRSASGQVAAAVKALCNRVEASAEQAARSLGVVESSIKAAAVRVNQAAGVAQTVLEIAQQSRILSINGAIQATRAGDSGKSFAVVARDMTQLAEQTGATAKMIEARLAEVRTAIAAVRDAAEMSSAARKGLSEALRDMRGVLEPLERAVSGLERTFASG